MKRDTWILQPRRQKPPRGGVQRSPIVDVPLSWEEGAPGRGREGRFLFRVVQDMEDYREAGPGESPESASRRAPRGEAQRAKWLRQAAKPAEARAHRAGGGAPRLLLLRFFPASASPLLLCPAQDSAVGAEGSQTSGAEARPEAAEAAAAKNETGSSLKPPQAESSRERKRSALLFGLAVRNARRVHILPVFPSSCDQSQRRAQLGFIFLR